MAKEKLNLTLDCPNPLYGGTSDTAENARTFFKSKNCGPFIELVNGTQLEKETLTALHMGFSVVLRIVSSKDKQIDTDSFGQYCNDLYLSVVHNLPWVSVPQSIHRLLAHSAEQIRMNDCHGLGDWSEEGLSVSAQTFKTVLLHVSYTAIQS